MPQTSCSNMESCYPKLPTLFYFDGDPPKKRKDCRRDPPEGSDKKDLVPPNINTLKKLLGEKKKTPYNKRMHCNSWKFSSQLCAQLAIRIKVAIQLKYEKFLRVMDVFCSPM